MADEYIRRQDAVDAVCAEWCGNVHDTHCDACAEVRRIKALPSADVVQVVRCKDCERSEYDVVFESYWCKLKRLVKPDDFCSYGKRREE